MHKGIPFGLHLHGIIWSFMSSSVSSERVFSQGGITITKWHNGLKVDIVKAL
jgi:hypothetical protein